MNEETKRKAIELTEGVYYKPIGPFRGNTLYSSYVNDNGVFYYGYDENRNWRRYNIPWNEITEEEEVIFTEYVSKYWPKNYQVTRENYLINFTDTDKNETIVVNLKDKKFTKIYKTGRTRDIKYPHSFFRYKEGRSIAKLIPADDNFRKLVDTIIQKESGCSNFGTFLVRMFDNIHLETYLSAGVRFSYAIRVPYNFFPKEVRKVIESYDMTYDRTVEQFFANDVDLGRSMLACIQEYNGGNFTETFRYIANDMHNVTNLVNNYKYDVKTLFKYCNERNWQTPNNRQVYYRGRDLLGFISDYARMADMVFPNGFEKYPKDIVDHHNGVSELYAKHKIEYDDKVYAKLINPKLELEGKEYAMIYPKSTGDIQAEGRNLNHCVGSYVQYVLDGKSIILFLRKKDEPNTSLITVEVKGKSIHQARGKYNRRLVYDEKVFLEEYAEKKRLVLTGSF